MRLVFDLTCIVDGTVGLRLGGVEQDLCIRVVGEGDHGRLRDGGIEVGDGRGSIGERVGLEGRGCLVMERSERLV